MTFKKPPYSTSTSESNPLLQYSIWINTEIRERIDHLDRIIEYTEKLQNDWDESGQDNEFFSIYHDMSYSDFIVGILGRREGLLLQLSEEVFRNHVPQERCDKYEAKRKADPYRWYARDSLRELKTIDDEKLCFDEYHEEKNRTEKSRTEKIEAAGKERNKVVHAGHMRPTTVEDLGLYCRDLLMLIKEDLTEVIKKVEAKITKNKEVSTK